jgi:hypothetical protein
MREMENRPKKHHYVPNFYLKGFTKQNKPSDKLYVFDRSRKTKWVSSPENSALESGFYAIDKSATGDEMAIEKQFSKHETDWGVVLKDLLERKTFAPD